MAIIIASLPPANKLMAQPSPGSRAETQSADSSNASFLSSLTPAERTWLQEHPVVNVVVDPAWAPFEFLDEHGNPSGISYDYLNILQDKLGIEFKLHTFPTWKEAYDKLMRWEMDMTSCVISTPQRRELWAFTEPYNTSPIVIYTRDEVSYIPQMKELFGKKVAVVEGYAIQELMEQDFPQVELIKVKDTNQGLDMLLRGQVFAYLENMQVLGYTIAHRRITGIKISGQTPYSMGLCMAVRKDWAVLAQILQKAMNDIPQDQRDAIYTKWMPIRYEHGFDYRRFWQLMGLFAVALAGLVIWNRRLKREIDQRRQIEKQLKTSREYFQALFESMNEVVVIHEPIVNENGVPIDLRFIDVNPSYTRQTGIAKEDVIGKGGHEIYGFSLGQFPGFDEITKVNQTGKPYVFEKYIPQIQKILAGSAFPLWGNKLAIIFEDVTDRRKNEQALRESEELFRSVFELASIGLAQTAPSNTRFLAVNRRMCDITGYSAQEMLQMTVNDITHPDDREQDMELYGRVIRGEQPEYAMEKRYIRKNGETAWVHVHVTVIRDAHGKPTRTMAAIDDITQRKQTEQALMESEQRFRWLFDGAADMFLLHDDQGHILDVNQVFCKSLGYTRHELLNMTVYDVECKIRPEDLDHIWEQISQGNNLTVDGEHRRKDGSTYPVEVHVIPFKHGDQQLMFAAARDITLRKQTEERMAKLLERLKMATQVAQMGIWDWDIPNDILVWDERISEMQGMPQNQGNYQTWLDTLHPDDRERASDEIMRTIETKAALDFKFRVVLPDGQVRMIQSAGQVFCDAQGQALRMMGVNYDITQQEQAEHERAKLHEQLQQAQKMEAIGRLAGGVAHDFNNLLTAIIGSVELAMEEAEQGSDLIEHLKQVNKAAQSATALTRQLLAFSRKQIVEPKVFNINEMISNLHKMLTRLIGENIDVQTTLAPGLGCVRMDPGQFEQVLVNLAVNARDAMPQGGELFIQTQNVELDKDYCALHPQVKPGPFVRLSVSDTGEGMSPEVRQHLFEPFYTTKPKGAGTGLGLATIFGVVSQAGGAIEVYSEMGKGTAFKVYLPRTSEQATSPAQPKGIQELAGQGETILLVEDQEYVRNIALKMLTQLRYEVLTASHAQDALEQVAQHDGKIDLLMTDVVMPGMNGRELAEQLLAIHPHLKVLFTSGYTEDVVVHHGILNEALNFLGKPYSLHALAQKIREILESNPPS